MKPAAGMIVLDVLIFSFVAGTRAATHTHKHILCAYIYLVHLQVAIKFVAGVILLDFVWHFNSLMPPLPLLGLSPPETVWPLGYM